MAVEKYEFREGIDHTIFEFVSQGPKGQIAKVNQDFLLYGQVGNDFYKFEIGKDYDGFLVKRKF